MGNINCTCTCNGIKESDMNISQFKFNFKDSNTKIVLIQKIFRRYMVQKSYEELLDSIPCKKTPFPLITSQIMDPNEIVFIKKTSKYFQNSTLTKFTDPLAIKELEINILNQYREFLTLDVSMNYFLSDKNQEKTILLKESDYVYRRSSFTSTIRLFILTHMANSFIIGSKTENLKKITFNNDITNGALENSISIFQVTQTQVPPSKFLSISQISKINDDSDRSSILSKSKILRLINEDDDVPVLSTIIKEFSSMKYSDTFMIKTINNLKHNIYYQGEYDCITNMRCGFGIMYSTDVKVMDYKFRYAGYFKDNLFHGLGILEKENGWIYKGEFRDNVSNGYGIEISDSGRYEGFWINGRYQGYGEFYYTNKNGNSGKNLEYKGGYYNGVRDGIGIISFEDGGKYFGSFKKNKMNGVGLFEWKQGHKYYGTWKNDKMNGKGKYKWKNGDMYIGEYENDLRHGKGEYVFAKNDSILKGQWVEGKKEGKFILVEKSKSYAINFKNDNNE